MHGVSSILLVAACGALSACAGSSNGANGIDGVRSTTASDSVARASQAGPAVQGAGANWSVDYSIWVLQLPTGSGTSATTISSSQLLAGYADTYFYPADDGGQIFMDPASGRTTTGSQHCRTEMRESKAGGDRAAWASSGSNTLTVSGRVLTVGGGSNGQVTLAQIFNTTDSIPLGELQYSSAKGGFEFLYEEAKGEGAETDLNTPIALNTRYTFGLELSQGRLTVTVDDKPVYARTPSANTLVKQFYFKFGNYDQTAAAGPVSTTPYTLVETYSVVVVHG